MRGTHFAPPTGRPSRLGAVFVAGEVVDDEPHVPPSRRIMDEWVLSHLLAGEGAFRHADGRTEVLRPGAVVLIPPGEEHWYGTPAGQTWSELFIGFHGPLFEVICRRAEQTSACVLHPSPRPPAAALRAIVWRNTPTVTATNHRLLALAEWIVDATEPAGGIGPSAALAQAADRLAADTRAELDLREVAAAAGMTYDTFRRRFTAELGQPPNMYRMASRLATAAGLLRQTDLTAREIARRLGFTDEFHLSKRFRSRYGVAPSIYRTGGRR